MHRIHRKLVTQLSLRYALIVIAAFALVFVSFYQLMSASVTRERSDVLNHRLDNITESLNNRVLDVMQLQTDLLHDSEFQNALSKPYASTSLSYQLDRYRGASYLFNAIYIFDRDLNTLAISRPQTLNGGIDSTIKEALSGFVDSYAFRKFLFMPDGDLYYMFSLYTDSSYTYRYYGVVNINAQRMLFNFTKDLKEVFAGFRIIENGTIQYETGSIPSDGSFGYIAFETRCENYSDWHITAYYDQRELTSAADKQLEILLLICVVSVLVILSVSVHIARSIVRPVAQVLDSMHTLESGTYPDPIPIKGNNEIAQLINGYNHMVDRFSTANQKFIEEQREKRELEVRSVQTQLELLQSQINPHFIHNTLNTLNYMALRDGNEELSNVIVSFNALLRASLGNINEKTTIEEEIDYVRKYMTIQEHRYADRKVDCIYNVEPQVLDVSLPRLILQPLVENSLFHGILPSPADRPGIITITCGLLQDKLRVEIRDNGIGIASDRMQAISAGTYPSSNSFSKVGLRNVRERIELMYPDKSTFSIESEEGVGTVISFTIPAMR